jgi:haloalkane dehalogenase
VRKENLMTDRPKWLSERVWPFSIRTAVVDGTVISYTDEGTGPTLVLVHDGLWSFLWGQAIERLRDQFRVITLDFPGSGLSPAADRPVGLESDSALLEMLVDRLELSELTLVAHDLGGPVGLGLAARRPDLVTGLVLVNTFAWPPHTRSLRVMLGLMGSAPMRGLNSGTNLMARATSGRFGVGRHLSEEARRAFIGPFIESRVPRRRFHLLMGSVQGESEYLSRIEGALLTTLENRPVLTVFGQQNDPFHFQARFKEIFPDVTEMVIPRGNHFPMCDDPSAFAKGVGSWHTRVHRRNAR